MVKRVLFDLIFLRFSFVFGSFLLSSTVPTLAQARSAGEVGIEYAGNLRPSF